MSETSLPDGSADREPETAETPTVRGFLRGAAWRRRIGDSVLPDATRTLLLTTVRATKLRPKEKLAVADELIAHFHDADCQGVEPADARDDFGDAEVAAKLIRRAKKRNRGFLSKLKTFVWWCLGTFVVFYACLALHFYTGEPKIKVDYLAKLNATAAAVPEDQRAWPELDEALSELGFTDDATRSPTTWLHPADKGWSDQVAFFESHRNGIERVRQLATRPILGPVGAVPVGDPAPNLMQSDRWLGGLSQTRAAARLLAGVARAAAVRGDRASTLNHLVGVHDLARLAGTRGTAFDAMAALGNTHLANAYTAEILRNHPDLLADEDLERLQTLLAAAPRLDRHALEGERAFFEDQLQRQYTDDGAGDGRLTPSAVFNDGGGLLPAPPEAVELRRLQRILAPLALILDPGRRAQSELHDRAIDALAKDLDRSHWDPGDSASAAFREPQCASGFFRLARHAIPLVAIQGLMSAPETAARSRSLNAAALLGLALHRHRLATGSFPDPATGYAELVPAYLDAIPLDPLHGTPMRWTLRDGHPVVYSLGADGDDDGGVSPVDDFGGNRAAFAPPEEAVNGDWIAWPPQ